MDSFVLLTPLPASGSQSTDEASDDHNPVHKDGPDNGGPRHAGCEEEVEEQQWRSDEPEAGSKVISKSLHWRDCCSSKCLPVDVTSIVDLPIDTANLGIISAELDVDRCPALVRAHGIVRQHGREVDAGGDVKEDAVLLGLHVACGNDTDTHNAHD
jgi:hypothetical protein